MSLEGKVAVVTDAARIDEALASTHEHLGKVSILVNNAAFSPFYKF